MLSFLLVGLGGALGAMARYGVGRLFGMALWPSATFFVNVAGGLAMGLLAGVLAARGGPEGARLFLGVGVLGGFTTYSAYSLEIVALVQRGELLLAALYGFGSVVAAAGALFAGLWLARVLL